MEKWQRRYAWEFPWPLFFTAVKADDPQRTNYSKLPTVDELIAEMGADATARAAEAAAQKDAIAQGQGEILKTAKEMREKLGPDDKELLEAVDAFSKNDKTFTTLSFPCSKCNGLLIVAGEQLNCSACDSPIARSASDAQIRRMTAEAEAGTGMDVESAGGLTATPATSSAFTAPAGNASSPAQTRQRPLAGSSPAREEGRHSPY